MTRNRQQEAIAKIKKLGQKQELFARLLPGLFLTAFYAGYGIRPKELWRHPKTAEFFAKEGKGIKNSLHISGLAIDIVLTRKGKVLRSSKPYKFLGEYWESLGGSWGGRFKRQDGGHFSLEHRGVR